MTDGEIRASYRQAKYPKDQIKILAQLNDKSINDIKVVLGLSADKRPEAKEKQHCRSKYNKWKTEEIDRLCRAYKCGLKAKIIAEMLDKKHQSVAYKIWDLKSKGLL